VKTFSIKRSNSGIHESAPGTQNNVSWISSTAELEISFLKTRSGKRLRESGQKLGPATGVRVGPSPSISCSIIQFPLSSHGGQHFANLKIIESYLSWIRMGTLELYPMWDIYGERRNLSEDYGSRFFFFGIVKFHKMSQVSHQILYLKSHLRHF